MTSPRTGAALLALALALPLPLSAQMTGPEREALRAEMRAYLLEHPEVLMEAIGILEERQIAAQEGTDRQLVETHAAALFEDGASWVGGNPEGDVTLVEFMDYRCGYCRQAHDEVARLVAEDGNIRLILKELPILGEQSLLSSRFAIAALQLGGADSYKRAHDALITFRGEVATESLLRLAGELGLPGDRVLAHMDSAEVAAVIDANRDLAARMQISGTPTFVIDRRMVRGYVPLEGMQQLVAEQREG